MSSATALTNEFRDAFFAGSPYGVDGVTVAVRIGFDDNRSLGAKETGGRRCAAGTVFGVTAVPPGRGE